MKGQLRSRDQRAMELQVETEQLREQAARQNAVIASLKKRIQVHSKCLSMCSAPYSLSH
jgi:predicted ATP-grasp superfamily ATP-dependent carboligase